MIAGFTISFPLSLEPTVSNSFARFAYALVLPSINRATSRGRPGNEWIPDGEVRESREVSISGPQLPYAVMEAECRDAGIMNRTALNLGGRRD